MLDTVEIEPSDLNDLIKQHKEMPKCTNFTKDIFFNLLLADTDRDFILSIEQHFDPAFRFMAQHLYLSRTQGQ